MFRENEVAGGMYQIIRQIGKGGIGEIYLAYHLHLQKYVVLKKIKDTISTDYIDVRNEVDILKRLHSPYLPQVFDFYQDQNHVFSVIDYIEGNDLEWYLANGYQFNEQLLLKWLRQLCEVTAYLHSQTPAIIHSDIKPANIIITKDYDICLIDFNISQDLNSTETINGFSQNYASPEQYYRYCQMTTGAYSEYIIPVDEKTDIYGIGSTFYHIMTHITPDIITGQPELGQFSLPYSEGLQHIISKAMAWDYNARYRNVREMLHDLDKIKTLEKGYKKFFLAQVLVLSLSGLMVIGGLGMIVHGKSILVEENYQDDYEQLSSFFEQNELQFVEQSGKQMINNAEYDKIFEKNPQYKSDIFYFMARAYYNNDQYKKASEIYKLAIKFCQDEESMGYYYRDYALCQTKIGNYEYASEIIQQATKYHVSANDIILIQAQIIYQNGSDEDLRSAIEKVTTLLNQSKLSSEVAYEARIFVSDAYIKLNDDYHALEILNQVWGDYKNSGYYRRMGNLCFRYAQQLNSADKTTHLQKAKQSYLSVQDNGDASLDDYINLGYIYNQLGNYNSEFQAYLDEMVNQFPDEFRFYMLRALLYWKNGDLEQFQNNFQNAYGCYNRLNDAELRNVTESEQQLYVWEQEQYDSLSQ